MSSPSWSWRTNPEILATVALTCLYAAVMSGHPQSIDGLLIYRQAQALAYGHSLHFSTPVLWGGVLTTSKYGIGLSLLYIPGLLLWAWLQPWVPVSGGNPYNWALFYQDPLYTAACAPVHILIVAASAYMVARLIRELGLGVRVALWGLVLYGLASPAIVYARGDWAQPLTGLCWIAALYSAIRFRRTCRSHYLALSGTSLACAVLTRPVDGSLLLPAILVLTMWPGYRNRAVWRAVIDIGTWYLAALAITFAVNYGRYGSLLEFGYDGESWTTPIWVGLAGALVSPGRGLLLEFPAIILLPVGARRLWSMGERPITLALALAIALELLNVATWHAWRGGWDWGLRLFVPALPLVAVLSAVGIAGLTPALRTWVPGALLVAGIIWAAPCIVTDLLNAYGGTYSSSSASFEWSAYPPIGAWRYLHHWRATGPIDSNAADILWLRSARATGEASLIWPAFLLLSAGAVAVRVLTLLGSVSISASVRSAVPLRPVAVPEQEVPGTHDSPSPPQQASTPIEVTGQGPFGETTHKDKKGHASGRARRRSRRRR